MDLLLWWFCYIEEIENIWLQMFRELSIVEVLKEVYSLGELELIAELFRI